jgi:hypothetical protein
LQVYFVDEDSAGYPILNQTCTSQVTLKSSLDFFQNPKKLKVPKGYLINILHFYHFVILLGGWGPFLNQNNEKKLQIKKVQVRVMTLTFLGF